MNIGGSQEICKKIVEKLGPEKVLLNRRAVHILQHNTDDLTHPIEIQLQDEKLRASVIFAKKVICTIPPNIIVKNITFFPGNS